jgi:hypothetical protein
MTSGRKKESRAPDKGYRMGQKKVPGNAPLPEIYKCIAREYLRYSKASCPYKPLKPMTRLNINRITGINIHKGIFDTSM